MHSSARSFTGLPRTVLLGLLFSLLPVLSAAQETDAEGTVTVGGGKALTIGGLLQTDASLGRSGNDGFRVRTSRLRLGGEATNLQYVVQTDFASSSVLLDALARLSLTEKVRMTAGLFKAPFGAEFLQSRPDLLFAERSRAANDIPPKRQAGVSVSAAVVPNQLRATVGAFNGTRGLQENDNDHLLYVGRLDGTQSMGTTTLEAGINAGYSIDDAAARPGTGRTFSGTRVLFGADARLDGRRWLLTTEVNGARLAPDGPADARTALGYYVAGGVTVAPGHQVLARFDQYDPDLPRQSAPGDRVTLGYNFDPNRMLRVLVNYEAPVDGFDDGVVTARLQVALR